MFMRCQAQYKYRYVDGLKIPPSGAMFFGSTLDKAVSENYRQKIETSEDMTSGQVAEAFVREFEIGENLVEWNDEEPGDAMDEGVKMVRLHMEEVAPRIFPATVQERMEFEGPGAGYSVVAITDLTTKSGEIIDHKTTGKTPKKVGDDQYEMSHDHKFQGSVYNVAYRAAKGRDALRTTMLYHVRTKVPKIIPIEVVSSDEQEGFAIGQIGRVAKAIDLAETHSNFLPNRGHFLCSATGCGYWKRCHEEYGPNEEVLNIIKESK